MSTPLWFRVVRDLISGLYTLTVNADVDVTGQLTTNGVPVATVNGLLSVTTRTLDHNDILALLDTPVTLLAAVGSGMTAVPLWAVFTANTSAGAYTIDGSALVQISAAGDVRLSEVEADSYPLLSDGQADVITTVLGLSQLSGFYSNPLIDFDNTSIQLSLTGTATSIINGHIANTLKVALYYLPVIL